MLDLFRQHLVNELNRNRALTDRRRDALNATSADVSYRENAREACFQQVWCSPQGPFCRGQILFAELRSGLYELLAIEGQTTLQPGSVRRRPGHQVQVMN